MNDPFLLATASALQAASLEPASMGAALARRALARSRPSVPDSPLAFAAANAPLAAEEVDEARVVWDELVADARRSGSLLTRSWSPPGRGRGG